jgi:hypothetical protein
MCRECAELRLGVPYDDLTRNPVVGLHAINRSLTDGKDARWRCPIDLRLNPPRARFRQRVRSARRGSCRRDQPALRGNLL